MAITEPGAVPDSGNISTARLDGDEWVLNGGENFCYRGRAGRTSWLYGPHWIKVWEKHDKIFRSKKSDPGMRIERVEKN